MSQNFMGISTESGDEIRRVLISRESLRLKKKKGCHWKLSFKVPNLPTMLTQMLFLIFFSHHVTIIYAINEV